MTEINEGLEIIPKHSIQQNDIVTMYTMIHYFRFLVSCMMGNPEVG